MVRILEQYMLSVSFSLILLDGFILSFSSASINQLASDMYIYIFLTEH